MEKFKLKDKEFIALCDLLKSAGLCESGGHAKTVIAQGEVKVDDTVELRKRCKITAGKTVTFSGQTICIVES